MTPQEPDPDFPVSVQESPVEVWVETGLLQGQGHRVQHCIMGRFEGGWPQAKQQGGNTAPPIKRKWD